MSSTRSSIFRSLAFWSLAALGSGLTLGVVGYATGSPAVNTIASLVQPLGILWLRALQLVVLPLVVLQLLTALMGQGEDGEPGGVGGRTLAFIILGSVAVMIASLLLALPSVRFFHLSPETVEAARGSVNLSHLAAPESAATASLRDWFMGLIPSNLLEAFANGQVIQVLLVTLVFGLAANRLPGEQRRTLAQVFHALNQALLVVVRWILWITPVGVFALMLGIALGTGLEAAGFVVGFVILNQSIQLLLVLAFYPLAVLLGNTSLRTFARAAAPVQLVAGSTRSSLATLPIQIESGRDHLAFGSTTTGVVVPLCVSLFKVTLLITDPVKLLFLAHVLGISLAPGQVITFLLTVLLVNFTEIGLPRGGVPFRTLPAYLAIGIPLEPLVVLQATNDLEDYADTLANATAMFAAATILSRRDRVQRSG